jgi:hypothetical protein
METEEANLDIQDAEAALAYLKPHTGWRSQYVPRLEYILDQLQTIGTFAIHENFALGDRLGARVHPVHPLFPISTLTSPGPGSKPLE